MQAFAEKRRTTNQYYIIRLAAHRKKQCLTSYVQNKLTIPLPLYIFDTFTYKCCSCKVVFIYYIYVKETKT